MGYSPSKCSMQWHTKHSSKTYKFLLKCLHVMDENVTHPFPHLEPSLTPSHMHVPSVEKTLSSKQKVFVFENTLVNLQYNFIIRQPSEQIRWTIIRGELLDNSPKQFFGHPPTRTVGQLSNAILRITFRYSFFYFLLDNPPIYTLVDILRYNFIILDNPPILFHVMTHAYSLGCPKAYEMQYAIS